MLINSKLRPTHMYRNIHRYRYLIGVALVLLSFEIFVLMRGHGVLVIVHKKLMTMVDVQELEDSALARLPVTNSSSLLSTSALLTPDVPMPPYTAILLYLIQPSRLSDLILSLTYVHANLHTVHPWPIVLFYDSPRLASPEVQSEFILKLYDELVSGARFGFGQNNTKVEEDARRFVKRIEWVGLKFELPAGISKNLNEVEPVPVFSFAWPGYHHMCAWFIGAKSAGFPAEPQPHTTNVTDADPAIFVHPRLEGVDFYMRLDTDSFIYNEVCGDPFEVMHRKNRAYGYRSQGLDPDWVTKGLWELVDDYAKRDAERSWGDAKGNVEAMLAKNAWKWPGKVREDKKAFEGQKAKFPIYYNNFEIVRLEAFRRADVQEWLTDVMSVPERVYIWRWGDAPVRFATVNMFFDVEEDVELFCGIDYYHQTTQYPRCNCNEQFGLTT